MYIGIDLGGINLAVGLVDKDYTILAKDSVPTGRDREFSEIMESAAVLAKELMDKNGFTMEDVEAIGLGSPGTPNVKEKTIVYACNFPKVHNGNAEKELQKFFPGVPVFVANDASAAAYGEFLAGAAKEVSSAVVITLGTGVGGGVVLEGKIHTGFNHTGTEMGHMVVNFNGPDCTCGRKGCFETYASATALINQTKHMIEAYPDSIIHTLIDHNPENINGKTAFDAAREGDACGIKIVNNYIEYLAIGIANIVNIFQPEAIVIGGGVSKEGENLLAPLREKVAKYKYTPEGVPTATIMTAKLGNDAGIIGAAFLVKQAK